MSMRVALIVVNPYRGDLMGMVLVARHLATMGITTHLVPGGGLSMIETAALAPNFVLLPNLRKNDTQFFAQDVADAGITIGVLDTEGGVFPSLNDFGSMASDDPRVRQQVSCYCAWGNKVGNYLLESKLYSAEQVKVTGAPKFDFYTPPLSGVFTQTGQDVNRHQPPVVLINGTFKKLSAPENAILEMTLLGIDPERATQLIEIERQTMKGLVDLVNWLADQFPNVQFVYRPHPFERLDLYDGVFSTRSNLHLEREGTMAQALTSTCAVIQRSSSTAVDAGMVGVPAFSPVWIPVPEYMEVPESLSVPCASQEELKTYLQQVIDGKFQLPESVAARREEVIEAWFCSIDGKAHERVADAIICGLEVRKPEPSLSKCHDMHFGYYKYTKRYMDKARRGIVRESAKETIKRKLSIPLTWRIRRFRHEPLPHQRDWAESFRLFDLETVHNLISAIDNTLGNNEPKVGVAYSQDRNEFHFGYQFGRSITIYPI